MAQIPPGPFYPSFAPYPAVVLCLKAKRVRNGRNKFAYSSRDCVKAKNQATKPSSPKELIPEFERIGVVTTKNSCSNLATLLRQLRQQRGISQLQLADHAGVNASVVNRAERGKDAKFSTWQKLFEGLGYYLLIDVTESSEEAADLLTEEADRRRDNRWEGLCAGKRRFY